MLGLRAGNAALALAPEIGGSILGWSVGGVPILRRPTAEAVRLRQPGGMASFPLVPYSNRIAHGKFAFDEHEHRLALNFGEHAHSIHGIGWQSAWQVERASRSEATLSLTHLARGDDAAGWPFAFRATQEFMLSEDALLVRLEIENLDPRPAPAGLGMHPYFPAAHRPKLHFVADAVWTNGLDHLPDALAAVPDAWQHAEGLPVGAASLDNCFAGWNGRADIAWASPGPVLAIEASDIFRHLVVFTPPKADFFCVEPVSHRNDAINRLADGAGHGMHALEPGQMLAGEIQLRILDL